MPDPGDFPPPAAAIASPVEDAFTRFEGLAAADVHGWLHDLLPAAGAAALDVGAGSGRDAAWLAAKGLQVVAVEPDATMLERARRAHPDPEIRWLSDSLPALTSASRLGLAFDLILASAVWMFVAPAQRPRAFRKLITLLQPGGRLALTLRLGPSDAGRDMHPADVTEIERLARAHGALVERITYSDDLSGRFGISWANIVLRLPDDGTGALPLLRHIILQDDKSSTYKLALLRALCRIADGAAGCAREADEETIELPLGLVGLYWLRLYKPLLAAGLPQSPTNIGDQRLGFVREGFRALGRVSPLDLRLGATFDAERARGLDRALRDACETIVQMPATFMTFADGAPVFPTNRRARGRSAPPPHIDLDYLWSFGELRVPAHLWRSMQRMDAWIEPALTAEWTQLMVGYATRQGRTVASDEIGRALAWSDPQRDVGLARREALRVMESRSLYCVWSGRRLTPETLDIDHCFPWAAWPCDDLWNLMPAHRQVNQHEKRDRLPSAGRLFEAQDRIEGWWRDGYLDAPGLALADRFAIEARASLPFVVDPDPPLVFEGVTLQQARLRADQGVGVWERSER